MGKGNTIIRFRETNYPTYYIGYYDHDEEIDDEGIPYCNNNPCSCNDTFYEDVISNITTISDENITEISHCLLESKYCKIILEDNEWSAAIGIVPNINEEDELDDETIKNYREEANRIMKKIHSFYNLRVRTSAWTSGEVSKDIEMYY